MKNMSPSPEGSDAVSSKKDGGAWFIPLLAVAAVVLFGVLYLNQPASTSPSDGARHPAVGSSLANFEVVPLIKASDPVSLDQLRGQVTLINYWGPWCYYCLVEMPHLVELNQRLADEADFRLLSISYAARPGANLDQLRVDSQEQMDEHGADWPVYADPQQMSQRAVVSVPGMEQGFGFPTTVLVDRQGKIAGLWVGFQPGMEADIERTVRDVLARGE